MIKFGMDIIIDIGKMVETMTTTTTTIMMMMMMITITTMTDQAMDITIYLLAVDLVMAQDIIMKMMETKGHPVAAQVTEVTVEEATTKMEMTADVHPQEEAAVLKVEIRTVTIDVQGMEEAIITTVPIKREKTEMDINIEAATAVITETVIDTTILTTATIVKMTLLTNVILILVLGHALARKNHDIQDAGRVIIMILCR